MAAQVPLCGAVINLSLRVSGGPFAVLLRADLHRHVMCRLLLLDHDLC